MTNEASSLSPVARRRDVHCCDRRFMEDMPTGKGDEATSQIYAEMFQLLTREAGQ